MIVYIAGPMRGHSIFNFPAFDSARDALNALGHTVISPADLDRAAGFDPQTGAEPTNDELRGMLTRDMAAVLASDAVVLLPGWYTSLGADAEFHVAVAAGIPTISLAEALDPEGLIS